MILCCYWKIFYRNISDEETRAVRDFAINLLSCKLDDLPPEVLSIVEFDYMKWTQDYRTCLVNLDHRQLAGTCIWYIREYCPLSVSKSLENECDRYMAHFRNNKIHNETLMSEDPQKYAAFELHRKCMDQVDAYGIPNFSI